MKNQIKKIVPLLLVLYTQQAHTQDLYGKTFFSPRSQGSDSARRLIGQHPYMHKTEGEKCYGTISATAQYSRSFKTRRVAEYFFGTDTINFSGSQVPNRDAEDILADYFGLSPEFQGSLTLNPQIRMFVMDFGFYCGLDNLYPGLYIRSAFPAVWTRHFICLEETTQNDGSSAQFPALYMDTAALTAPAQSIKKYFEGNLTYGHVQEGITFGKIGCVEKRGLADFWFALGWNFIREERGHFGINIQAAGPTGSTPNGTYMFEPVVGNGDHWELGFGFTGALLLWEKDGDQTVTLNVDANFTHLFKSRQCRTFDFCENGFGSRFILLKEFDSTKAYTGTCIPAINKTTLACDVWASMKIDAAILASYKNRHWTFDFGYNGWIRTREKINLCGSITENSFGFKGIQDVDGAGANNTQSSATLYGNTLDVATQASTMDASPVFIKTTDLDLSSAASPLAITHKFFTHLTYVWDYEKYQRAIPYFGLGFSVEFEGIRHNYASPNKNTLSLFALVAKGGLVF